MNEAKVCFGFDLGAASVGSAVLGLNDKGKPHKVMHVGSRIFELPGGGNLSDFTAGKNKSPNEARREARGARRQIQRKAKRRNRIIVLLQKYGLLDAGNIYDGTDRNMYFAQSDAKLIQHIIATNKEYQQKIYSQQHNPQYINPDALQVFPYYLRKLALEQALNPVEFGRAIYHLSQRRGFLSNRKDDAFFDESLADTTKKLDSSNVDDTVDNSVDDSTDYVTEYVPNDSPEYLTEDLTDEEKKADKDLGKVKAGIKTLQEAMKEHGSRTVGEYLAGLKPSETRIRGRFTSRAMIEAEFEALWQAQKELHAKKSPDGRFPEFLADGVKNSVHKAIFYQRPLKSQKGLVGCCSLYPKCKKASFTLPEAQEFRLLQKINDLCWFDEQLTKHCLSDFPEKYATLYQYLLRVSSIKFGKLRTILGLPGKNRFNFETDGEKGLIGHRLNTRLLQIFGEAWFTFEKDMQKAILHDMRSIQKSEILKKRGQNAWGLSEEKSAIFAKTLPDDGSYCAFSSKALQNLLPSMREGKSFGDLRPELTETAYKNGIAKLPPVGKVFPELRNPVVARCLSELRSVVNMLLKKYGLPEYMAVEMARDLKRGKKQRGIIQKNQQIRRTLRGKLKAKLESKGIKPTTYNTQKLELAEECGWQCPYTGNTISWETLFTEPIFEIEHILPYSRTFDDSMANKTLCHRNYNAQKRGSIPFEAAQTEEEFERILRRVRSFYTKENFEKSEPQLAVKDFVDCWATRRNKVERFSAKDLKKYENFMQSMLNDTRHASRLAVKYLGLLYPSDEQTRITVGRGGVTHILRNCWDLNSILSDGGEKTREDHRHHAVDAVVTACTNKGVLKALQDEASGKEKDENALRFRLFTIKLPPWEGFWADVKEAIDNCLPSLRINSKVRGKLHKETAYGFRILPDGTKVSGYKDLIDKFITPKTADIKKIIDIVKKSVAMHWQFNSLEANLKIATEEDLQKYQLFKQLHEQFIKNANRTTGKAIRSIRTIHNDTTLTVGSKNPRSYLNAANGNHHTAFFEVDTPKGKQWVTSPPVTLLEATNRLQKKQPIVNRQAIENGTFIFTLASGNCIEIITAEGVVEYLKVRTVAPQGKGIALHATRIVDARLKADIAKNKNDYFTFVNSSLQKMQCKKIIVLPDGTIRYCRD